MNRTKLIPVLMATVIAAGGIGAAYAQSGNAQATPDRKGEQNQASEMAALETAKVTLSEAIAIAETDAGGKAIDAGLEDENGQVAYEVEVFGANGEQTVYVDAQSGKVVKMAQAEMDENEDGENGEDDSD